MYGTYSSYGDMEVLQHSSSMSFDHTFPLFHLTVRTHLSRNVIRVQMVNASYWHWKGKKQHSGSTRSPFVTSLSRRAQTGTWSSFGKRVWFTESHIVLFFYLLFCLFIIDIKWWSAISSRTTKSFLGNWQSFLCTRTYTTLVRDWIRTAVLASAVSS